MTTLSAVTDAQLVDAIKAVISEAPDRVYAAPAHMSTGGTCYYVHTDANDESKLSPGCLIGVALNRLGVPLETLQCHENNNAFNTLGRIFPTLSDQTRSFANSAQMQQDNGATWGEALAYAESRQRQ